MKELFSIGRIAELVQQPIHRVLYVIRTRDIKPVARAGAYRLFSASQAEAVRKELSAIDAEKSAVAS